MIFYLLVLQQIDNNYTFYFVKNDNILSVYYYF